MDLERSKNNGGGKSRPVIMASSSSSKPPLPRKLVSPSSSSTSDNHTRNFAVRFHGGKLVEFTASSSSEMTEKRSESKLADSSQNLKGKGELRISENRHISARRDLKNDQRYVKSTSKMPENSPHRQPFRSGDNLEKKSPVSDQLVLNSGRSSEKENGNEPPVLNSDRLLEKQNANEPPVLKSGRSSEKLKEDSTIVENPKPNKMYFRTRVRTKSINEVVNSGNPNPITAEDLAPKTWNLRPRRPPASKQNLQESTAEEKTTELQKNLPESKVTEKSLEKNKKKMEFSISLSKEEIEADFLAMTGSKPPRRSKKRGKTVQNNLDYCFPGLWLHTITPNSYRVSDDELKLKIG